MTNYLTFKPFTVTLDHKELLAALEVTLPMVDKDKHSVRTSLRNVALSVFDDNGTRTLMTAATNRYYAGKYVMEYDQLDFEGECDSHLELTPDGVKAMIAALKQVKTDCLATLTVQHGEITLEVTGQELKLMEGTAWNLAAETLGARKIGKLFENLPTEAKVGAFNADYLTTVLKAGKAGMRAKFGAKAAKTTSVVITTDVTKPAQFTVRDETFGWEAILMPMRMPAETVKK